MDKHLENCKFYLKKHEKNEDIIVSKPHKDNEVLLSGFICNDKREFNVMIIVTNCKKEWQTIGFLRRVIEYFQKDIFDRSKKRYFQINLQIRK